MMLMYNLFLGSSMRRPKIADISKLQRDGRLKEKSGVIATLRGNLYCIFILLMITQVCRISQLCISGSYF